MKKIISLVLSVVMMFSCVVMSVPTMAATKDCLSFTVSGKINRAYLDDIIKDVNAYRAQHTTEYMQYSQIGIDANLQNIAERRAMQLILHKDYDFDTLPDGRSVSVYLPGYNSTEFTKYSSMSNVMYSTLKTYINSELQYSSSADVKSVGIGIFSYGTTYVYYLIKSVKPVSTAYSLPQSDYSRTETVDLNYKYISYSRVEQKSLNNYGADSLSFKVEGDGYFYDYFYVPNSQIKFVSSNNGIYKIKGTKGYAKKNGKATLCVKDKAGKEIVRTDVTVYGNSSKPSIDTYNSKAKKKSLKVAWYTYSNVAGYQVQYSLKKNMKGAKTITIKGKNKSSKLIKKLKSKKKYYVRVRAFVNQGDGEKQYTQWSAKKSFKIK